MFLNQLHQLGAASHRELPDVWRTHLARTNDQRRLRHLPPIDLVPQDVAVDAYVNRGAWVADCVCNGGMAVSPEWPWCCCLDCGRVYAVNVPDQAQILAATVLLERRPEAKQNWYPADEPIRLLQAENKVAGLDDSVPFAPNAYTDVLFLLPAVVAPAALEHVGNLGLGRG